MADDGVSWYFEMVDRMTAPSKQMERALGGVSESLKHVDQVSKSTGEGIGIMSVAAGEFLKDLGEKALEVGKSFIELGLDIAKEAFSFAVEGSEFRRNMEFGFRAALGTSKEAAEVFEQISGYVQRTGLSKDAALQSIKTLLGAGYKRDDIKPLVGALSDIAAMNGGDAASVQNAVGQLTRLKDLPRVSTRELLAFGQLGISSQEIFQSLATQQKITLGQAKTLFESGAVRTVDATNAILSAIRGKTSVGKLGALGEEFQAGSITAQIQHLKDSFAELFEHVNLTPITNFLKTLTQGIGGSNGEKMIAGINAAFASVANTLSHITLEDVVSGIKSIITLAKDVWNFGSAVVAIARAWGSEWSKAFGVFQPAIDKLGGWFTGPGGKTIDWLSATIDGAKFLGQVAGASFGMLVVVVEALGLVAVKSFQALKAGIGWLHDEFEKMKSIGSDLVNGIWEGITGGWRIMLDKFHALVELLPASVKKVLGIASPSKVFADLGLQTARGFTIGLDAGDLSGAMGDAVAPPSPSAMTIRDIADGRMASPAAAPHVELTFNIHTDGSTNGQQAAQTIREEMERVVIPSLITAFEQLQIETGG